MPRCKHTCSTTGKKCRIKISKDKQSCHIHNKNTSIEIQEEGICFNCGFECNVHSQICGRCARGGYF